jgi:hypothetical protein
MKGLLDTHTLLRLIEGNFSKLIGTTLLAAIVVGIGKSAIDDLGELIHFNCRPQGDRVICELTHEPLIGSLQTCFLDKTDLIRTSVQSKRHIVGRPSAQLVLVTRSQGELPLTRNGSSSANKQLFAQRDRLDRFLNTRAETLNLRTHRPGQLWVILGGVIIFAGIGGTWLWLSKSKT